MQTPAEGYERERQRAAARPSKGQSPLRAPEPAQFRPYVEPIFCVIDVNVRPVFAPSAGISGACRSRHRRHRIGGLPVFPAALFPAADMSMTWKPSSQGQMTLTAPHPCKAVAADPTVHAPRITRKHQSYETPANRHDTIAFRAGRLADVGPRRARGVGPAAVRRRPRRLTLDGLITRPPVRCAAQSDI